ncbi:unnamed protein product [Trichobilharzia szidati]|nr:unnamed protein product [Trichobilharzia szidati]
MMNSSPSTSSAFIKSPLDTLSYTPPHSLYTSRQFHSKHSPVNLDDTLQNNGDSNKRHFDGHHSQLNQNAHYSDSLLFLQYHNYIHRHNGERSNVTVDESSSPQMKSTPLHRSSQHSRHNHNHHHPPHPRHPHSQRSSHLENIPLCPGEVSGEEDPKPNFSYIGLIAKAILSTQERRMILSEIYQWIQLRYPYFRTRGPGWRNSIRHNLSLNDCFIKVGRAANGKGHYWGIHPANLKDFLSGDFRRRRAQRKVRRALGLTRPGDRDDVDDTDDDDEEADEDDGEEKIGVEMEVNDRDDRYSLITSQIPSAHFISRRTVKHPSNVSKSVKTITPSVMMTTTHHPSTQSIHRSSTQTTGSDSSQTNSLNPYHSHQTINMMSPIVNQSFNIPLTPTNHLQHHNTPPFTCNTPFTTVGMNTSNELKATLETLKHFKYFYPNTQMNIPPSSRLNVSDTLTDLFYANLMHLLHNNSQSSAVTPHSEDHLTSCEQTRPSDQSTHLSCSPNDCSGNDEKSRGDSSNPHSQEHSQHSRVMNVSFNVANLIDHQNHHDDQSHQNITCDNDGDGEDNNDEDEKSTSEGKITDDNQREYDSVNRQSAIPCKQYSTTPNHQLLDMEDELLLSVSNNSSASSNTESPLDYSLIK